MIIPHNRPTLGKEEIEASHRVITSGNLAQGNEVERFESEVCEYLGYDAGHAVALSSGSAALYMAIRAMVDAKKTVCDVIIPAYSCSALKNAVELSGNNAVYVDVDLDSPNVKLTDLHAADTDVIIACHMYGMPMKIKCEDIIEDCAQAVGSTINGIKIGTQTNISVFSFYATKPITSGGEGGMLVSKDRRIIEYIKDLRDFDMKHDNRIRFNFKMTDLQAAVGREQLKKLDDFVRRRRYLGDRYEANGIPLWNRIEGGIDYRGLVRSENQQKLLNYLSENGIGAIIPIEDNELLCEREFIPRSYELTKKLVSIPLYPSLCDEAQDIIIRVLKNYMEKEGQL